MATNTTNYNLTKPDPTDFYDIGVTNENLDKIDTAIKSEADKISALTTTVNNKTQVATTAEAQAGTDNTKVMTPLRVKEVADTKVSTIFPYYPSENPDTTTKPSIVTEVNGKLWYIETYFYGQINGATEKLQRWYEFNTPNADFKVRHFTGGSWTPFTPSLQDLKSSVSNGKAQVASAITGKGIPTASDATFATLANNISLIETGIRSGGGNVLSSVSFSDYFVPANSTTIQQSTVSVSGLDFTPSVVILSYFDSVNNFNYECVYKSSLNGLALVGYLSPYITNLTSSYAVSINNPSYQGFVRNGEFSLPIGIGGVNVSWRAFE